MKKKVAESSRLRLENAPEATRLRHFPMRRLSEYKHVVWDWNGTLLDDLHICLDSLNALMALDGRAPISRERYLEIFEFPVINVYRALGFPTDERSFKAGSIAYMAYYESRRDEAGLHSGARDTLAAIRDAGLGQSVLSAYRHDLLETIVSRHGIGDYFTGLSGNGDIYAAGKAERARGHRESLGLAPHEILYVGDTVHDAETAHAMGADCVLLAHGHQPRLKLEATGVRVVAGFTELRALM